MAKNDNKENKHFWKDFRAEIKKVIWPSPKQLVNSTVAIITMVLIVAVIVFVLDLAFDAFNKYALTSLQEAVQSTSVDENTSNTENQASSSSEDAITVNSEDAVESEVATEETTEAVEENSADTTETTEAE